MRTDQTPHNKNSEQVATVPKKKRRIRFRTLLLLCLLGAIGIVIYDGVATQRFLEHANQNRFTPEGNQVQVDSWDGHGRVNILMLGVDNREKDVHPRSDTMILLSIDPETKKAVAFSILRDTYVPIEGFGKEKINAAFANGGPDLVVKTVRDFLQVPINYYMVTDFQGFEGIVNAVGGVDIDVEKDLVYADDGVYDINLKAGFQHLDGKKALMYARFRKDAMSDFGRTDRQRKIVKAVASEMKSPLTVLRFPNMLKAAEPYVQTNIKLWDAFRLAPTLLRLQSSEMQAEQVPPMDNLTIAKTYEGEDILRPDTAAVRHFVQEKLNQQQPLESPKSSGATTPAAPQQEQALGTATVGGEYVNVRQGPNTQSTILDKAYQGDKVTILAKEGDWSKIRLANGTVGYIANFLLQGGP